MANENVIYDGSFTLTQPLPLRERGKYRGKGSVSMRMKNPPGQRERARVLRRRQTLAEQRLWKELRDRRFYGVKFKRQQIIGSYIADFCSKSHKLVIEIDGG